MDDDPSKIIESSDDAQSMIDAGASFGETRATLMAEYALSVFKAQNTVAFPELTTLTEADERAVENIIAEHITNEGW